MNSYICPDCDGRVFHQCHPPSYYLGRRLPRFPGLRKLRRVQLPDERRDTEREGWARAKLGRIADSIEEADE